MKKPTVSVIVPAYNHENFIGAALTSVCAQTFQDLEIIVVDDGSHDATVAEAKKIKDSRLKVYTFPQNKGACVAANYALRKTRGKYIAMLSSDDLFKPQKLEKQVAYLEAHPEIGAVFTQAEIIDQTGQIHQGGHFYSHIFKQPNRTKEEWLRFFFFNANCLCHPSVLIRKAVYNKVGNYDERFAQLPDLHFWVRVMQKFNIHILPEKLTKFRIHTSNISGDNALTHTRHQLEFKWILEEFLHLSPRQLPHIFPEAAELPRSKIWVAFFLSQLSLELAQPSHLLFALETLFKLLTTSPDLLSKKYNFTYKDFYRLTGQTNIFNLAGKNQAPIREMISNVNYLKYELGVFKSSFSYKLWRLYIKMFARLI